jgi:hypothetical protein
MALILGDVVQQRATVLYETKRCEADQVNATQKVLYIEAYFSHYSHAVGRKA